MIAVEDQVTGLEAVRDIVQLSDNIIKSLHQESFDDQARKRIDKRYTITQAADMVSRTTAAIRKAESTGALPASDRDANGRRIGYSLIDINRMRDHFGTRLRRQSNDPPAILAVQNFKGGAGKSTVAVHLAQYLAERGLRVLLIDCDSQASTTSTFGIRPDSDNPLQ